MSNIGACSYDRAAMRGMRRTGYGEFGTPITFGFADAPMDSALVAATEAPVSDGQSPEVVETDVVANGGRLAVGGEVVVSGTPDVASVEAALLQAIRERRSLFGGDLGSRDDRYLDAIDRVNALKEQLAQLTDEPKSEATYARLLAELIEQQ